MSQTDRIKLEKIEFLENHSETFYKELFNKNDGTNSTIYLITSMLLKEEKLEDCEEYVSLNGMILEEQAEEIQNSFLSNILNISTQFLTRLGAVESVNVILSYFSYKEEKEFSRVKTLYMA